MDIQFVDLRKQYARYRAEIDAAISRVIGNTSFVECGEIESFERDFAKFCGTSQAVAVSNGMDALMLIFESLGLTPGDEVIVPTNSFIATALAPSSVGAKPVLVDCDPRTYNLDPAKVEAAVTPRTKVICPTHLYGQAADMDAILKIAAERRLTVVEDACQAHGATFGGRRVGSFGYAAAFSFFPGKNLGAYGHAGAITTNDGALAERLRRMRIFGQTEKYVHPTKGRNARMDGLQAAILGAKLPHLDEWNARRRQLAALYTDLLSSHPAATPFVDPRGEPVFHVYAVQVERRDELMAYMKSHGVACNIHYPIPIHLQQAYAELGHSRGDFPEAERLSDCLLSLPMYPELEEAEVGYVVKTLADFYRR